MDSVNEFNSPARSAVVSSSLYEYIIGGRDIFTGLESDLLDENGTYFVRISAMNAVGTGPIALSSPASVTLSDSIPDAPVMVSTVVTSSSSLSVFPFLSVFLLLSVFPFLSLFVVFSLVLALPVPLLACACGGGALAR